jgi:N-acetylmuramoyl-L-alanine amidase
VSWHYTVDDNFIVQQLPVNERAWHAGPANASSIAIEICMNRDMNAKLAYENAADLVASLVKDLGLTKEQIRTHESWTGKECPRVLLQGINWGKFLDLVGSMPQSRDLDKLPYMLSVEELDAVRRLSRKRLMMMLSISTISC